MTSPSSCPDESDLLAFAQGDAGAADVRAHVDACPHCARTIAGFKSQVSSLRLSLPTSASASAAGGQRPAFIGQYFVVGVVDADESVTTYRAVHAVLHQEVALTTLNQVRLNEAQRSAWTSAARPLLEFNHPGVARVYDFGFFGEQPFVVEERAEPDEDEPLPAMSQAQRGAALCELVQQARAAGLDWNWQRVAQTTVGQARLAGLGVGWLERMATTAPSDPQAREREDVERIKALVQDGDPASSHQPTGATVAQLQREFERQQGNARRLWTIGIVVAVVALVLVAWLV